MISVYFNVYRAVKNHVLFTYVFCFCIHYNNVSFLVESCQMLFEKKISRIFYEQINFYNNIYTEMLLYVKRYAVIASVVSKTAISMLTTDRVKEGQKPSKTLNWRHFSMKIRAKCKKSLLQL